MQDAICLLDYLLWNQSGCQSRFFGRVAPRRHLSPTGDTLRSAAEQSRVQRVVKFCCYIPKLLLLFLERALLQDNGELQPRRLTGIAYQ